ncbi:hypothetical protein INT08_03560 [Prosthecochloris sp. N3]|uniref:Uncharacterized protein n=1 Tax=Prosthecochloris ethylica TaxID=2743976 RepID=A0ABR9XQF3_9CHLB|nr:CRISPR-associated protein Csx15 [Prosthecochloris ethylica]MBF0585472.1 hypothetical protein [Prosthecochloris ethylica]MBF0636258.1 hypothetical protein [Prosthecochloris ethylica]NUK46702.1 hypothetical protein [Prosthecochloris ethylica]
MEQFFEQGVGNIFGWVAGIVACMELIEYLFTKNLPWISRMFRNAFRWGYRALWRTHEGNDERFLALNFSGHPVLPQQAHDIQKKMGWPNIDVIDVPVGTVSEDQNFLRTATRTVDRIDLLPNEWQSFALVVIPSGYAPLWAALLADLHGRLGHFPDMVRLRPSPKGAKEKFEVAEIIDLRDVRQQARSTRSPAHNN